MWAITETGIRLATAIIDTRHYVVFCDTFLRKTEEAVIIEGSHLS